ncbi:MAG: Uma2 family endonuclease [Pyrinomonadaceae bacterium]|jgi:Uma2 family endonuclease|nr:Uma2 family endonuclease [Pyrinomonadaceae bacterium]
MIAKANYLEAVQYLPPNGTLLLHNVSWDEYENILQEFETKSAYRIYFNNGVLKIMSPRFDHEFPKDVVLKVVTVYADEFDIDVDSYGSTTWRQQKKSKGAEADTSFYVKNAEKVRGIKDFDLNLEIPPDIVVEVDTTNESWDKFEIYADLGVKEIWRCDGKNFQIYELTEGKYEATENSRNLPLINGKLLTELLEIGREIGQTAMLKDFRTRLRESK